MVYEIVWEKYMTHFLGASTYSQAIVLSTFMLGLGIGSHLIGNYAEKKQNPLLLYAVLEFGIGVYALLFPFLMTAGERVYVMCVDNDTVFGQVLAVKFIISFLLMAFPTVLMGGTMPVLSKYIIRFQHNSGRRLSQLYYLNCLGAVIGCVATGFYLISEFGLRVSMTIAAAINILLGFTIYILQKKVVEIQPSAREKNTTETSDETRINPKTRRLLIVAFLSGFAAMLYEVAWIRIFSNVLGFIDLLILTGFGRLHIRTCIRQYFRIDNDRSHSEYCFIHHYL